LGALMFVNTVLQLLALEQTRWELAIKLIVRHTKPL